MPKKRQPKNQHYDRLNNQFLRCVKAEIGFEQLLQGAMPYLTAMASSSDDPCDAISRMSVGLYKLTQSYNPAYGAPMAVISTMARRAIIDQHRKVTHYTGEQWMIATDPEDIATMRDSVPPDPRDEMLRSEVIEAIERADLTEHQKGMADAGKLPHMRQDRLESFRNILLSYPSIRERYG
jgi:hypothetical protein